MSIQYFMDYVIFFQDPGEYTLATAIAGGNLLKLTPRDAATLFGIPYPYPTGDMATIPRGIYFLFPFTVGAEIRFAGASGIFVDDTILTKVVPGQAGSPASTWPAGPDGVFTWSGNIIKNAGASTHSEPTPRAIPQRRWIHGQELSESNEGGFQQATAMCRDYSRTIDGHGWGIRGNNINGPWSHNVSELRPGLISPYNRGSWERFYVRVRRLPVTNNIVFWRCKGNLAAAGGTVLKLHTNGEIRVAARNSISVDTDKGLVFRPTLNTWYRIDLMFTMVQDALPTSYGKFNSWINGIETTGYTVDNTTGGGLSENNIHTSSELGRNDATADNEIEMDFDDWICSDFPSGVSDFWPPFVVQFGDAINYSIDWLVGSHVRAHPAVSVNSQVNWAPAATALVLNQIVSPDVRPAGTTEISSSTALAQVNLLTDALTRAIMDTIANTIGIVASVVSLWSKNAGATDGKLGIAGTVLTTIDQTGAESGNKVGAFPGGQILPAELAPLSITHEKSNDANLDTTYMLSIISEYIGVWGPEDDISFQFPITRLSYLHNCRYANTAWGYVGSQPAAPQYSIGFTYVGNGGYQEFVLPAACHFLRIRPVTDTTPGIWFQAASLGAHFGTTDEIVPGVRMWFDFTNGQFKMSVTGNAGNGVNIVAKTYQVIAFCDPGMRFCLASAFSHGANSAILPKANPLVNPNFTPLVTFFQFDFVGSPAAGTGTIVKGPAETANAGRNLQTFATTPNVANYAVGNINSFDALHLASTGPCNFIAFRTQDSGPAGCLGNVVIQVTTYVGNGAGGNRAIVITPTSGRFPLLTMVWPASGVTTGYQRDPSHAGSNSSSIKDNSNIADGITVVGIDTISVGPSLNANGVTYTIFTICGDSAGNNNGTFFATYCGAGDPPWLPPLPPGTEPNILGNGGLILGGAVPFTVIKNASGIYTLVPGQNHDALIDRNNAPSTQLNVKIPDPTWKTGYLGG